MQSHRFLGFDFFPTSQVWGCCCCFSGPCREQEGRKERTHPPTHRGDRFLKEHVSTRGRSLVGPAHVGGEDHSASQVSEHGAPCRRHARAAAMQGGRCCSGSTALWGFCCGGSANWASRLSCRGCGGAAPATTRSKAQAAYAEALAARAAKPAALAAADMREPLTHLPARAAAPAGGGGRNTSSCLRDFGAFAGGCRRTGVALLRPSARSGRGRKG